MKVTKVLTGLAAAALVSGCSTFGDAKLPEGIEKSELYFCQHYGNLYANIAHGREIGIPEDEMVDLVSKGIAKARMPAPMRPTMEAWAPVAVYRVYSAPDILDQGDWRHHVETECLDRIVKIKSGEIQVDVPKMKFIEGEIDES